MDYIEKLDLQTEEAKEIENLEKHNIINNNPFTVDEYIGHTREFLAIEGECDNGFNQLNKTVSFGVNCDVSREVKGARKDIIGNIHNRLKDRIDNIEYSINFVTPEQFGAVGDGINDDTNALFEALSYPYVKINRKYRVTQGNKVINHKIHIFGNGEIYIEPQDEKTEFIKFLDTSDCIIEDVTFSTDRTKIETPPENHTRVTNLGSNICAMWCQNTENMIFRNIKYNNMEFDIRFNLGTNNNILIENHYSKGSSLGVYAGQLTNAKISNYNVLNAIELGDGDHCIYLQHDTCNNITFSECNFIASDENLGTLVRLSDEPTIVNNIKFYNCIFKGKTMMNSATITNEFHNCIFECVYETDNKTFNGVSGTFYNCKIYGLPVSTRFMLYKDNQRMIFRNCYIDGKIQFQVGTLEMYNCEYTGSIYTSGEKEKNVMICNSIFTADSSNYLMRCSTNLKSVVMNNLIKAKNIFTSYQSGNIAINNAYTGKLPDGLEGGQNILITLP